MRWEELTIIHPTPHPRPPPQKKLITFFFDEYFNMNLCLILHMVHHSSFIIIYFCSHLDHDHLCSTVLLEPDPLTFMPDLHLHLHLHLHALEMS